LHDDKESLVARAVEKNVDRGPEGEKKVTDKGADLAPWGPLGGDDLADEGVDQLKEKYFRGRLHVFESAYKLPYDSVYDLYATRIGSQLFFY
jgi:hypothetical protein